MRKQSVAGLLVKEASLVYVQDKIVKRSCIYLHDTLYANVNNYDRTINCTVLHV